MSQFGGDGGPRGESDGDLWVYPPRGRTPAYARAGIASKNQSCGEMHRDPVLSPLAPSVSNAAVGENSATGRRPGACPQALRTLRRCWRAAGEMMKVVDIWA